MRKSPAPHLVGLSDCLRPVETAGDDCFAVDYGELVVNVVVCESWSALKRWLGGMAGFLMIRNVIWLDL